MNASNDSDVRQRLQRLLSPRTIAIVGASEKSPWTHSVLSNYEGLGYEGPGREGPGHEGPGHEGPGHEGPDYAGRLHLVNRSGASVFGRTAATSCQAIGETIDLALMLVPADALPDAVADAAAAGACAVVVLASGYSEAGEEGERLQRALSARCAELGVLLLGPNCLGYFNFLDRTGAWTGTLPEGLTPGAVAIVSQSGGMGLVLAEFAGSQHIGISHLVSTGNEAMLDTVDVIDALLYDERVRAIAVFSETIRDPQRFMHVAREAAHLRKPIVMMKVGTSALAAEIAQSHTGSLVGDDGVIDAALRSCGVIRAHCLEELVITAALLAQTGPLPDGGLGVVSVSGGACDVVADRAEALGISLPKLSPATEHRLREQLPAFATVRNPIDITGAGVVPDIMRNVLQAFAADPSIALLVQIFEVPPASKAPLMVDRFAAVAAGLAAAGPRGVHLRQVTSSVPAAAREVMEAAGMPLSIGGIDYALQAMAHARWWSRWLDHAADQRSAPQSDTAFAAEPWSEFRALQWLAQSGVPVVPARSVTSIDEAVAATRAIGFPVVLKIVSPQILHKSDIGGVVLNVRDEDGVRGAFKQVMDAGRKFAATTPGTVIEGVMVVPMRQGGTELIVGIVRDPAWGCTLTLGLGGIWVNVLREMQTRLLPLDRRDVHAMLEGLRGIELLHGARGTLAADMNRLVAAILAIGDCALQLGERLASLEINPLRVHGTEIEALDALITWQAN